MRMASIFRRVLPSTPLRAGTPPLWDRPDPPASATTPRTRRLNMEEKHFSFFDGASSTYMLVNSEVAEGDLLEAFPNFVKRLGFLFLSAFIIGGVGFLWASQQQNQTLWNYSGQVQSLESFKQKADSKYGLKDLINNPWKLNVWPQVFPKHLYGGDIMTNQYKQKTQTVEKVRKVNKQALAYWNNLYAQCQKAVQSRTSSSH